MKQILVSIISVLIMVCCSAGISNAASRSENNVLFAEAGVYNYPRAMKWQNGRDIGVASVKINRKYGNTYYKRVEYPVNENSSYNPYDDSDPRSKYQWYIVVSNDYGDDLYLYYNFDYK